MITPFATFHVQTDGDLISLPQSPHLFAHGVWYIKLHSVTTAASNACSGLLKLECNLVQANPNLERSLEDKQFSERQCLAIVPVVMRRENKRKHFLKFDTDPYYQINCIKSSIIFYINTVSPIVPADTELTKHIHFSLYKEK